ncbi:transporter substrate-binding domain-containing protein [Nocardia sp. NPDC057227]|uniref:transporter substrate-binding domain-containing protein n=1 Tax=Nocardia sp. NPDC057227 TaxID=3346056 RepID=UPI003632C198
MRRRSALAVLGTALAAGLTGCHDDPDPSVLRVGTEGTYPPFSVRGPGGAFTGYDIEVADAVGARLGKRVEFTQAWLRHGLVDGLASGVFDLLASHIELSLEIDEQLGAAGVYATGGRVFLTLPGAEPVADPARLRGHTAVRWNPSDWPGLRPEDLGATVVEARTLDDAVRLLREGGADVVPADSLAVADYRTRTRDDTLIATPYPDYTPSYTFVTRRHDPLAPEVRRALAELRADGTLRAISERYFGVDVTPAD